VRWYGLPVGEHFKPGCPSAARALNSDIFVSGFLEHDVELFHATEEHFGSFDRFSAFFDSPAPV
jgi:hypothetical protein